MDSLGNDLAYSKKLQFTDMDIPSVTYEVFDESEYFYVFAMVGSERVGELLASKVCDGLACLGDIKVKREWNRLRGWGERLKSEPFRKFDTINFQNIGIGTNLIQNLKSWCTRNNIVELYGSVVPSDLKETPLLLIWYERRGFRICDPTVESLPGAVKMVVWKSKPSSNSF